MKSLIPLPFLALALLLAQTASHAQPSAAPTLAGCPMFPADNIWNTRIDNLPVHSRSSDYINSIGANTGLHADFGAKLWQGQPIGIPYVVVNGNQAKVPVRFDYADESDPGPYPIPDNPPIEGGGDKHVLVLDKDNCVLYETWNTRRQGAGWAAGSGAKFDLRSHALRPETWTSADAAGLPILHGLVRYDEASAGEIAHAIRFTVQNTQRAYVWPARHYASSMLLATYPPMGMHFRLKSSVDISRFSPEIQAIFTAFKRYGLILADNGSDWFVSGVPDSRWNDDALNVTFRALRGSDFEAVDTSSLILSYDSGQVRDLNNPSAPTAIPAATLTPISTDIQRSPRAWLPLMKK
jgi:hypothetical protein